MADCVVEVAGADDGFLILAGVVLLLEAYPDRVRHGLLPKFPPTSTSPRRSPSSLGKSLAAEVGTQEPLSSCAPILMLLLAIDVDADHRASGQRLVTGGGGDEY